MRCLHWPRIEIYYNSIFENEEDSRKYKIVLEKFDAYFCPKSNITFWRFKFFNVKQQENQLVDDFINDLKQEHGIN